jgi:nitroimidazol reductase NimA-like FMN-containing flavoprotein (pyridoxamine 5'-phosphate oxidase superfamily)
MGFKLDIAMTPQELEEFLGSHRTVRIATIGPSGPHNVPYWYTWYDGCIWFNTTLGNLAVRNAERDPRASATVDDGEVYEELRGATINGRIELVPRTDPRIEGVETTLSNRYLAGNPAPYANWPSRQWFCLKPETVHSWDFRKIPAARAAREAAKAAAAQGEG